MSDKENTKVPVHNPPLGSEQFNNGYRPPSSESRPPPPTKPPSNKD